MKNAAGKFRARPVIARRAQVAQKDGRPAAAGAVAVHGGPQPLPFCRGAGEAHRRDAPAGAVLDADGAGNFPERRAGGGRRPRTPQTARGPCDPITRVSFCRTMLVVRSLPSEVRCEATWLTRSL